MLFEHALDIAATEEVVWRLTTDLERWPAVTPTTMKSVQRLDEGPLRPGSTARIHQPGQRPTVWTVTHVEAPRRFEWYATVFGVRTVATHVIEPTADGCRNHLSLELSGRGAGLMGRLLGGRLRKVLATENECFRRAAVDEASRPSDVERRQVVAEHDRA